MKYEIYYLDSWNERQLQTSNDCPEIRRNSKIVTLSKMRLSMDDSNLHFLSYKAYEIGCDHRQLSSKTLRRVTSTCGYCPGIGKGCWYLLDRWAIGLFGQLAASGDCKGDKKICDKQSKERFHCGARFYHVNISGRPSYRLWRGAWG